MVKKRVLYLHNRKMATLIVYCVFQKAFYRYAIGITIEKGQWITLLLQIPFSYHPGSPQAPSSRESISLISKLEISLEKLWRRLIKVYNICYYY